MKCFGPWQPFREVFKKLMQSNALDALDWLEEGKEEKEVPAADIRRFLGGAERSPEDLSFLRIRRKHPVPGTVCFRGGINK